MRTVREVIRRDALGEIREAPLRQLQSWLAYHGHGLEWLAEQCGGVTVGTVSNVIRGIRTSRPILERIEALTGIPAKAWRKEQ